MHILLLFYISEPENAEI